MQKLPKSLLRDVGWCFALDAPKSRDEMVEDACFFATFTGSRDPKVDLLRPLPFADVRLRYEYGMPAPRWRDADARALPKQAEVRIAAGPLCVLTGADLLWELHLAFAETLAECHEHFLQGLELESEGSDDEPPRYRVLLAS